MITKLTAKNYNTLFSFASSKLVNLMNMYPELKSSFNSELHSTIELFNKFQPMDSNFSGEYLVDMFNDTELDHNDQANRQVIFTLANCYFLTGVWYTEFRQVTGFTNVKELNREIGVANNILADYTKNTIHRYTLATDELKLDKRNIGNEICMSWLTYEDRVLDSLDYMSDKDVTEYHNLVNIALHKKLGLNQIYFMKG